MLKFDLSQLDDLIKKFRDDNKIYEIVESEFLNYLDEMAGNTVGQENHEFINREGYLEGSVDYYVENKIGYIVSEDIEYNSYVYYGSEKHNTTWPGDPWIRNVYNRDKEKELDKYQRNLTEELYGYLT